NPSRFAHPQIQRQHLVGHHKSASFGSNLYQQSSNFGAHPGFQSPVRCTNIFHFLL
ncbi:unnamed protein product, partial [Rotaria magnacalcarata]